VNYRIVRVRSMWFVVMTGGHYACDPRSGQFGWNTRREAREVVSILRAEGGAK
jgi:hypothetical protein